ncbi:MAG: nicotinate-nucleotide diphosphorylase, partial [Candidatus Aminicenantales bacterium]
MDALIQAALEEDMPRGDITTESLIPSEATARAILLAKENGVLAGIPVAERVFKKIDASSVMSIHHRDGESVRKGDKIADIKGPAVALLKGERTALNFLQRLSGIATTTRKFVDAVSGTRTRVLDTRKTTP